ncbi:MAG: hypothetical protein QG617_1221 [Campylobacterota bacterium]|nr:hypothetical protein [Campylobacterota bacterium]
MSLKENISMIKEELNSEEKFFEKAVITEKFIKKYKKIMIISVAAVVVVVGANIAYNVNESSKISAANAAFAKLQTNANDAGALDELKALSPNLYDVWIFSQAVANKDLEALKSLKNSKALIVTDLVEYEMARDAASLENYASKQDVIFRDLALVQGAVMLLHENKIDEAKNKLSKVSKDSSLNKLVAALMHYGIK